MDERRADGRWTYADAAHGDPWRRGVVRRAVRRISVLMAWSLIAGVVIGFALPWVSAPVGEHVGLRRAVGVAFETMESLMVDDHPDGRGYDRASFDYRGTDDDGDGCDVRDEVLARDMTDVRVDPSDGCTVRRGVLEDPYTGSTIRFTRGSRTSSMVQIDHVVALENAWRSGARGWDSQTRRRFGNDQHNLMAVDGDANEDKGSASAAYWLPSNTGYRCRYVARQIAVKSEYGLSITTAERRAMTRVLGGCPGQALPDTDVSGS